MKRYDIQDNAGRHSTLVESDDGGLVYYSDVQSIQAERYRLREALKTIQDYESYREGSAESAASYYASIARRALEGEKG